MKKEVIDRSWTLFLDRDGVINRRTPGAYITCVEDFHFLPGSLEAMPFFREQFGRLVIVTNQKGVGKGLMTEDDLKDVHEYMLSEFKKMGVVPDAVYAATAREFTATSNHKPNPGMALQAQQDFPDIDFKKSVMVGDSLSDMEFGLRLGMKTVLVEGKFEDVEELAGLKLWERVFDLNGVRDLLIKK